MKKLISALLVCLLVVCACGKTEPTKEEKGVVEKQEEGYYLNYDGHKLVLNKEFNTDDYGQYETLFENEACAFGDKDITYFYKDVEVEAYRDNNGKMIVYSIRIVSEEGKTNEGIGLYDLIDDAILKYGENYAKDDNIYKYTSNNTELIFVTENDLINSIEYRIANLG